MVYFIIGNPATTQVARIFQGETALECAEKALAALPAVIVRGGQFLAPLGESREDSRAWDLIDRA